MVCANQSRRADAVRLPNNVNSSIAMKTPHPFRKFRRIVTLTRSQAFARVFALSGLMLLIGKLTAQATALTWDADPTTGGLQDGGGTWNSVTNSWWDGAANTTWNSATPDTATFGVGSGAAGNITIS